MSRDYMLEPFRSEINLQIDYARELNPQQLAAVTAPPGPALVIAGAGSGKTRTLTYRVAYLLEQGIPPDRILLLTFTNKAAGEMMRRVADLLGRQLPSLWGGTFHSIGARILRQHADLLGYQRDFTILDRDDAKDLIKACIADAGIETKKGTHFPKPDVLCEIFSLSVNTHKTTSEMLKEQFEYFEQITRQVADVQNAFRPGSISPWKNCFLAGDWTATGWPSTMEGAARSGHLAAEAICREIGDPQAFLKADLGPRGLMRLFSIA